MARKAKSPEDYAPFRVAEESYFRDPRPEHAGLGLAAGRAVMNVMLNQALVDSRGRRLKAEPFELVRRLDPSAGRQYTMEGATIRHPAQARNYAAYWGLPLERAKLVEPEDLALSVVDALHGVFEGTGFWEEKRKIFRSGLPDISYTSLAFRVAEAGAVQPEELTARSYGEYITHVGSQAVMSVTGSPEVGGVQIYPDSYKFLPKAQELRLR